MCRLGVSIYHCLKARLLQLLFVNNIGMYPSASHSYNSSKTTTFSPLQYIVSSIVNMGLLQEDIII
jgi:hypothetical protein